MEPKQKLSEVMEKLELDQSSFITLNHGEIYDF